jgi:cell division protein FtsN
MTRDYKSARGRRGNFSGTAGFLLGLAIGLGIALAVFVYDRRPAAATTPEPQAAHTEREAAEDATDASGKQFDFYEMLPKFEVVVPEREKVETTDARPAAIQRPGAYVLQAGSYRNFADADRVRAQLALQGIESQIQRVSIDKDTWHRVRIGPIGDLGELERTREKLRQADIEAIVVRVAD